MLISASFAVKFGTVYLLGDKARQKGVGDE
jgi:hypothetical protein